MCFLYEINLYSELHLEWYEQCFQKQAANTEWIIEMKHLEFHFDRRPVFSSFYTFSANSIEYIQYIYKMENKTWAHNSGVLFHKLIHCVAHTEAFTIYSILSIGRVDWKKINQNLCTTFDFNEWMNRKSFHSMRIPI